MVRSAKHWVFTVNNWEAADHDRIRSFVDLIGATYVVVGRERGENNTPHLQGFVSFDRRRTFDFVRGIFANRAHIEIKRGTVNQAIAYCKKDGDFDEYGQIPVEQGHRSDIEGYKEWLETLAEVPTDRMIALEHTTLWFRSKDRCKELAKMICPPPSIEDGEPRVWQAGLIDGLNSPAPLREVLFYVDEVGNSGKSWIVRKLVTMFPDRVQILGIGRKMDLAYSIDTEKDIFIFDIHRGGMEFLQYGIIENLKDRVIYSSKYQSETKILSKVPHVVVFSNEHPDMTKFSQDRYIILHNYYHG